MKYFTIDRNGGLQEGQTISLIRYNDVNPPDLQMHVDMLFPEGVTNHGERYMLNSMTQANSINGVLDLLFEYVRRSNYRACPSRFQSIFGFDSIEQANQFRNKYGKPNDLIWEIESNNAFKADMNLLTLGTSLLVLSYNAHRYWQGIQSDDPFWEYLLIPPIKVVQVVKQ